MAGKTSNAKHRVEDEETRTIGIWEALVVQYIGNTTNSPVNRKSRIVNRTCKLS